MTRASAAAKINLALIVGPRRDSGKHELATVYQRITLADRLEVRLAEQNSVAGFQEDSLVQRALESLTDVTGRHFHVRLTKRIPVAAGLGGGSADAAAALRVGNVLADGALSDADLHELAAGLGADVPFFLRDGPHLGEGDGSVLSPLELPQDFWILLVLPRSAAKTSTADVYARFDARGGEAGFEERREALHRALAGVRRPRDLAALPPNDLASSPIAEELARLGSFRADVTGAGPVVYGLFHHRGVAERAAAALRSVGPTWIAAPAWYV